MTLIDSKPASVTVSSRGSHRKPLVYSCSGCSSAAQMANDLAVRLDREEVAEMSCIAGVGGDVPSLVDDFCCIYLSSSVCICGF